MYLAASLLAVSSAEVASQQTYSIEISKILINDSMDFLKQDEKIGRFTSCLYIWRNKAMTALVELQNQVFVLGY